jgi:hypothetical protein
MRTDKGAVVPLSKSFRFIESRNHSIAKALLNNAYAPVSQAMRPKAGSSCHSTAFSESQAFSHG